MAFTDDIIILFANPNKRNIGVSIHSDDHSGNKTEKRNPSVEIFGNIAWTASILPHCRVPGTFFLVLMTKKATQLQYIQKSSALVFRKSDLDFGHSVARLRKLDSRYPRSRWCRPKGSNVDHLHERCRIASAAARCDANTIMDNISALLATFLAITKIQMSFWPVRVRLTVGYMALQSICPSTGANIDLVCALHILYEKHIAFIHSCAVVVAQ